MFKNLTKSDLSTSDLYATIDSSEKVDNCIAHFTETLLRAEEKSVPLKKPYIFRYPESEEIKQLIRDRNRRREYSAKFPILRKTVNYLNRLIKTKNAQLNADSFNEKLKDLQVKDLSLYRFARAIKNKRIPIPPLRSQSGELLINEKGKADALAETFHKSHIISNLPTKHSEAVKDSLTVLSGLPINIPRYDRVKLKNLKEDIQRLKIKKASGDLITNVRLRSLPDEAISCLATLFNACFDLSYFPDCWKLGKVVAIAKPGKDSHLPTSYRPITLLPSIGKLFEVSQFLLVFLRDHRSHRICLIFS